MEKLGLRAKPLHPGGKGPKVSHGLPTHQDEVMPSGQQACQASTAFPTPPNPLNVEDHQTFEKCLWPEKPALVET